MLEIIATLRNSPVVSQVHILDFVDETTSKYLKCRADIIDGSLLFITEATINGSNKYSYHWQDSKNGLIIRWDNAPHHKEISTYPHHRHEGNSVLENPRVTINEILDEISRRIKSS